MQYFVAVAEELHFGRAAARLHMAQPPLSQAVRALEAELGVQLLHRTTRRVELTPAGSAYLERARRIMAEIDAAGHEARLVASGAVGRLSVGCVGSATYSLLPALARGLSAELPGVEFAFRGEMLVPDQIAALHDGTIDLGLLRPPREGDPGLALRVLRHDRLLLAVPGEHRLSGRSRVRIGQLRDEAFIAHSSRRGSIMHGVLMDLCRAAGFSPSIRHEVDETSTLITLVAGGLGVAVVPEPVRALALSGVSFVGLSDSDATVELAVAHGAERDEPHLRRAVAAVRRIAAPG